MERKVHAVYFSPVRSTAKLVKTIAKSISNNLEVHDLTSGALTSLEIPLDDIVVFGVPSFSGRVPQIAKERLARIKGKGTSAILVCTYGNRAYEDTLLELNDICTGNGFVPVSAGAFISRHTIFPEVAQGRPDISDIEVAKGFARQSMACLLEDKNPPLTIPGNYPYRERSQVMLTPLVDDNCTQCGKCARLCPVGAINADVPSETDVETCIACARCIHGCKQNARSFNSEKFAAVTQAFIEKNSERKEIELFYS